MACSKPKPFVCFLINFAIVLVVCLLVDFLVYGLIFPGVNPYQQDLVSKLLFTLVLSIVFAHAYNKASVMWAPASKLKFVYQKHVANPADECKATWPKMLNGMIFSALLSILIIMCILLSGLFISFVYLYVFQGTHGDLPTRDMTDIGGKLLAAGMALEIAGKTEDDPRM